MEDAVLILRLILAGVFVTAATAKLLDSAGARKAMHEFGVPLPAAGAATAVLILLEFCLAFLFIPVETSKFAALSAAVLLLIFTLAMLRILILGKSADCRCFGQLQSRPVDTKTIVRNVVLIVLAGVVFLVSERGLDIVGATVGGGPNIYLALLGFGVWCLVTASVIMGLESRNRFEEFGSRLEKLEAVAAFLEKHEAAGDPQEGMPVGSLAREVTLADADGKPVPLSSLYSGGKPALVILAGLDCIPCEAIVERISEWGTELSDKVELAVVTDGDVEDNVGKFGAENRSRLLFQNGNEAAEALGSRWAPTAVLIGPDGRIASRPAAGDTAIEKMVEYVRKAGFEHGAPLFVGPDDDQPARGFGKEIADFKLKTAAGTSFTQNDMLGQFTLAVFWSLTCPHCTDMLDQLKSWRSNNNGLRLAVFADGNKKDLGETGLEETLILDKGYKVSETMGMHGTPSAVVIDDKGRIVSELVAGAERIRLLAGFE